MKLNKKAWLVFAGILAISAVGSTQIKQVIKIIGVGAAVKQFGPDINKAINKLASHKDTSTRATKVVPIISAGINSRQAIGAAQVMGPKSLVDKVQAVAQLDQDLFGREVKIRAMIPVESQDVVKGIRKVDGVGVSGIVDLKL
jgi:phosphopantothenoylcysteine synthetase/decarboxylase